MITMGHTGFAQPISRRVEDRRVRHKLQIILIACVHYFPYPKACCPMQYYISCVW